MSKYYWEDAMGFGAWRGQRARRGDISPLILKLLKEKPMHGYEVISKLEERSHGLWRPSAGSVYPNLQMLEEEELVAGKEENGKRVYSLTPKGEAAAEKAETERSERWEEKARLAKNMYELKPLLVQIVGLLHKLAGDDSEQKSEHVKKILTETRDKLDKLVEEK